MLECCPPGRRRTRRRRKGIPRNSWTQEVSTGMKEKGITNMEWMEREEWRRINISLETERCESIDTLYKK